MDDIVDGRRRYKYNDFDINSIINRSMVISGQSETGKSFVLNSILSAISKHVGRMFGFASTALADEKFPFDKYTHPGLIKTHLDMGLIKNIHQYLEKYRGEIRAIREPKNIRLYAMAVMVILNKQHSKFTKEEKEMYGKILEKVKVATKIVAKFKTKSANDMNKDDRDKLIKSMVDAYVKVVIGGCRLLLDKSAKLVPAKLKRIFDLLIFNPKTVIVINDLSSDIRGLAKDDLKTFQDLLDKGRHADLTVIILLHDWACMKKELRNAIHNHIFTSVEMVNNFISIQQYKGELAKTLHDAAATIIQKDRSLPEGKKKFSMIFWMRLTGKIEYVVSDHRGKQVPVGTKYYYELAKKQQRKEQLF